MMWFRSIVFTALVTVFALIIVGVAHVLAADLPDPEKTPGKVEPRLTMERLCAHGFTTKSWRHVSVGLKNKVYKLYQVKNHAGYCVGPEGCEIDHLISLEIGGANNVKNLWPQSFGARP